MYMYVCMYVCMYSYSFSCIGQTPSGMTLHCLLLQQAHRAVVSNALVQGACGTIRELAIIDPPSQYLPLRCELGP
jgi:hypothetical protein